MPRVGTRRTLLRCPQIVQLEMEKLSIQRSADTDRHSAERLHAIDDQLVMLREEQQVSACTSLA